MRNMRFAEAVDDALAQAMAEDDAILVYGEDTRLIRNTLFVRFGEERVRDAPISEAAFVGAAVTAAMAGLRPVVELMLVDFAGTAMDALLNHAAKVVSFSGGRWNCPLVVRTAAGGGYGDGGQHEQSLWGWLAHIPGLSVVVPSTPADAGGLMLAALQNDGPVIYVEHKLLAENWLDSLGAGGRKTVQYDVPEQGARGPAPDRWEAVPLGKAVLRREGRDLSILSLAVGVHRALQAAQELEQQGVSAEVIDLRSVSPLDEEAILESVSRTGRMLVVDEDYTRFGLSGELAAVALEAGLQPKFGRVCTDSTIPYARDQEDRVLPSAQRISQAALRLMQA